MNFIKSWEWASLAFCGNTFKIFMYDLHIDRKLCMSFYFDTRKKMKADFHNFRGKQTKYILYLKFRVCRHTLNMNSLNIVCLFFTKIIKICFQFFLESKQKLIAFYRYTNHTWKFWKCFHRIPTKKYYKFCKKWSLTPVLIFTSLYVPIKISIPVQLTLYPPPKSSWWTENFFPRFLFF